MNFLEDKEDDLVSGTRSAVLNPEDVEHRQTEVAGIVIDRKGRPVAGQLVELYAGSEATGASVASAITDVDGCYSLLHNGRVRTYSVRVTPPFPSDATTVTPDPAVISHKSEGIVAAGIFVIH